jgi:iron complex outermembrane receptor protein
MKASVGAVGALIVLTLLAAPGVGAQISCTRLVAASSVASTVWPPPLDRVVPFQARDVSLRDALGRLAASARIRLSYSSELLPLDRQVCLSHDAITVGDALTVLLSGTTVEPRAVAADHVALAPIVAMATKGASSGGESTMARRTSVLDRVVIIDTTHRTLPRSLPVNVDVVSGPQIDRAAADGTLSRSLGVVPGIWLWEQAPANLLARYGSIRGSSSFSASYPKMYIDGIEVANPLLVTQVSPDMVERIEVIRGPQGAALYGTGAISGVINIVTRNDAPVGEQPRFHLRSDAGVSESDFASGASLAQHHSLTMRAGSALRSAGLGVMVGSVGAYAPDAFSRRVNATGSVRFIGSRSIATLTGRFVAQQAGQAGSPLVSDLTPMVMRPGPNGTGAPIGAGDSYTARQYTLGATGRFMPTARWTHTVTVGVDGYRLADVTNVTDHVRPLPFQTGASLDSVRGSADRATLRLSSVASFGSDDRASASLTVAAEHSMLREGSDASERHGWPLNASPSLGPAPYAIWHGNSGVVVQSNVALRDALYVSGGLRAERNDGFAGPDQVTMLPMLGAALVRDYGDVTLKLRGAYGKGIRPHRIAPRDVMRRDIQGQALLASLAPEAQTGVEAGVDLSVGRKISLQVTRFDQLASGLIQRVGTVATSDLVNGPGMRHMTYALQNVGEISNRGWELQTSAAFGRLSLGGTVSLVDSRVRRLAAGYTGDLRAGDRMLEVPARMSSATASWTGKGWLGALTASRAADWVSYDRLALAWSIANGDRPLSPDQVGSWQRSFWRTYDGVTRLRLTTSRDLRRGVALMLTGENLLDRQLDEPDNVTVVPGRTITAGIRAAF